MADNDEYQFEDLDAITPHSGDEDENLVADPDAQEERPPVSTDENNLKRNVLIVVVVFILILVVYKFMGASSTKPNPVQPTIPAVARSVAAVPSVQTEQPQIQPVMPAPQLSTSADEVKINQTLSTIEVSQQNLRADVTSVNSQLGGISSSLAIMMTKMAELNGIIANLSAKIDEQATVIEKLTIRREPKKVHYPTHRMQQHLKFYLQAVIPGRAWLVATNGTTLTVREGTPIVGYGIVKLIDSEQGRVTTSSGQVIRFSQEDS